MTQPIASDLHARLASAITLAITAAHDAGLPLEIKLPAPALHASQNAISTLATGSSLPDLDRIPDIEKELLRCLGQAPNETATLPEFAAFKGVTEDIARGQLRGGGRATTSVADDLYDRFDTHRAEGIEDRSYRKVRTYRLTDRGREAVKTM